MRRITLLNSTGRIKFVSLAEMRLQVKRRIIDEFNSDKFNA